MTRSTDDAFEDKLRRSKHASFGQAKSGGAQKADEEPASSHVYSDSDSAFNETSTTSAFSPVKPMAPSSARNGAWTGTGAWMGGGGADRDPRRARKIPLIVSGAVLALLAIVYVAGAVFFMGHFYPNTTLGSRDISLFSLEEVEQILDENARDYELKVSGFGFSLTLASEDIDFDIDAESTVQDMVNMTSPWAWPVEVFLSRDVGEALVGTFDDAGMNDLVRAAVEAHNETATPTEDATIEYSEAEGRVVVKEESLGTQLDADAVVSRADEAVTAFATTLALTDDELIQPSITADDERLQTAADAATTMTAANMSFLLGDVEVARLDGSTIITWIALDEEFNATLNDELLTAWASELASQCTTVGTTRTYTRPDGKEVTVSGGVYGWSVDEESLIQTVRDGVAAGSQEDVEMPCTQTAEVYNGQGSADWGTRYLDIDLTEQYVRFYDNGEIIWESACISGVPNGTYDTSTGVFVLNAKQSPSTLQGYENGEKIYETEVTYWMPFDRNVIGLHDATWQSSFGGTLYRDGYGSHGCVNLPYSAAQSLYSLIQVGDVVISHY